MTVMRAKMVIEDIRSFGNSENLKFRAVYKSDGYPEDGSDENNTFAKFTPSADLSMSITNPALIGKFARGETFYVDFIKAD